MHPYGMQESGKAACFLPKIPENYLSRQFKMHLLQNNILHVEKFYIFLRLICLQKLFSAIIPSGVPSFRAELSTPNAAVIPSGAVNASRSRRCQPQPSFRAEPRNRSEAELGVANLLAHRRTLRRNGMVVFGEVPRLRSE
jgi:hypothetical protein